MNDKNDNVYRPRSTGIVLAAILLILIIAVLIVAVVIFANQGGSGDNQNNPEVTTTPTESGSVSSSDNKPNNDDPDTPENPENPDDDNNNPSEGQDPDKDKNIPAVGSATIPTNKVYEGSLLLIDENNDYKMSRDLLISRTEMKSLSANKLLETYNFRNVYGTTDGNYLLRASSGYYLNVDTLDALNKMMADFASEQGKTDVQLRNAYYFYEEEDPHLLHATGYVVDLEVYVKGKGTYALNHTFMKETYYDWFIANCAKYGFIHIGNGKSSSGEDAYSSFRYVGEAHAAYITNNNLSLASYLTLLKEHGFENRLMTTSGSGDDWWIYYVPATDGTTTFNTIGKNYVISGNNTDGFVVAVNASAFKRA